MRPIAAPDGGRAPWRPAASAAALRLRARALAATRAFFAARGVMEVETPLLGATAASDVHLDPIAVPVAACGGAGARTMYLQTSPESAMKRLLAAGSGPIYQIGKAFRAGERGPWHNPEFTIVEWYRPGLDLDALIAEVHDLVAALLGRPGSPRTLGYAEAFRLHADVDPLCDEDGVLRRRAVALGLSAVAAGELDRDGCLDLLMSRIVAPALGAGICSVRGFPTSQAAMARIETAYPDGSDAVGVAARFETFVDGIELANGYHELADPVEQEARFERDLAQRAAQGRARPPVDARLVDALRCGLPDCSGVALGFDRLLAVRLGAGNLDEVLAFPVERA